MTIKRVSYSLLTRVERNLWDDVMLIINGGKVTPTDEMNVGSYYHELIRREVNEKNTIPQWVGNEVFEDGDLIEEKLITTNFYRGIDLSGIVDFYKKKDMIINDWKFTTSGPSSYLLTAQLPLYAYLLNSNGINTKYGKIHAFDPITLKKEVGIIFLSTQNIKKGIDWAKSNIDKLLEYIK